MSVLQEHRENQRKNRDHFGPDYRTDLDLIFATSDGSFLKPDSVSAKVSLALRKIGFKKGISLHTLRHSHGSHLLSNGVPLPAVSKRPGHSNPHVTATIYSHALDRDDQVAADAWDRISGSSLVARGENLIQKTVRNLKTERTENQQLKTDQHISNHESAFSIPLALPIPLTIAEAWRES
jgi:hypothetical protein